MTALAEVTIPVMPAAQPDCPYRGLDPFTEKNRHYFFGREEESMTIAANLLTAPVTVLYGTSGVGKSSVLMAGVIPFVRVQPRTTVVLFREWPRSDLIRALNDEVEKAVRQKTDKPVEKGRGFDVCVASAIAATQGTITIVFDQFEEFLLYHAPDTISGAAFDRQFARLANREDAPVNFLLGIREDCVARLDRFQRHIPDLLSNMVRLDRLSETGARLAVVQPLETYNAELARRDPDAAPYAIEPELVSHVLEKVRREEPAAGCASDTLAQESHPIARVETPFLQMILIAVWTEEKKQSSPLLRLDTLESLGGADRIVHRYVDDIVQALPPDLHEVCARIFNQLVTPSRSKIAHSIEDLEEMVGDESRHGVREVVRSLMTGSRRILRRVESRTEVERYEIFHDVLAAPILKWRNRYQEDKRNHARLRAGKRRMVAMGVALALALGVLSWLVSNELEGRTRRTQREEAERLLNLAMHNVDKGQPALANRNLTAAKNLYLSFRDRDTGLAAVEEVCSQMLEEGRRHDGEVAISFYRGAAANTREERRRVRALLNTASAQLKSGLVEEARHSLRDVENSKILGSSSRMQVRTGQLWAVVGDYARAFRVLDDLLTRSRAKKDWATVADVQYSRGVIFQARGDDRAAMAALEDALDLKAHLTRAEDEALILGLLAPIYERVGDTRQAAVAQANTHRALAAVGNPRTFLGRAER